MPSSSSSTTLRYRTLVAISISWLGRGAAMIDLTSFETLTPSMLAEVDFWRRAEFVWRRWAGHPEEARYDRDCCRICSACICDARDRDPYDKPGPVERGHYRHAFYAENTDGACIWVCRSCFKRIRPIAGWTIRRSRARPGS